MQHADPATHEVEFLQTDLVSTLAIDDSHTSDSAPRTRPTTLSPSVLSDLSRFANNLESTDPLPVVAASLRHMRALVLHIRHSLGELPLHIFPREQRFGCAVDLLVLPPGEIAKFYLTRVEPWDDFWHGSGSDAPTHFNPLRPLLWLLALHGPRESLLPEISGSVRYRLGPGVSLRQLPLEEPVRSLVWTMRDVASSFDELSRASGLEPRSLSRLLNALYLQSGLIVSRALLAARREQTSRRRVGILNRHRDS
jgi:hypothetical protein